MTVPVRQVTAQSPQTAEVIERTLAFPEESQLKWWRETGVLFSRFLQAGNYNIHEQYQHLLFLYRNIIPILGPYPPRYKTFQTRSGIPIEYSLNFQNDNTKPLLRISCEPVNYLSGTDMDPCNQLGIRKLMTQLSESRLPEFDSAMFHHFVHRFFLSEDEVRSMQTKGTMMDSIRTHALFGFDLKGDSVSTKGYMSTRWKSLSTGVPVAELTIDSIYRLAQTMNCTTAVELVHSWMSESNGYDMRSWVAWDNVPIHQSRLKFYGVHNEVTLSRIQKVWTLDGRLNDAGTTRGWELIERLWELLPMGDTLTNFSNGYNDEHHNTEADVTPSPLMWNYEVKSGCSHPFPKIYFPVHGGNDLEVAQGVAKFFESIGWKNQAGAYEPLLRSL